MKHVFASVVMVCLCTVVFAQPPAGQARVGEFYGKNIRETEKAIPASELPAMLGPQETKNVMITGKVIDVCPKKGCWAKIQLNDSTTATIKMKGYSFFVPMALIGKKIAVDGKAELAVTSVKDLKHLAEDAKKSQAEIDAIKEPKEEFKILADGIKVVNQ